MLDQVIIGEKIKSLRLKNNITQETLASILYVTRQAISRWEQGLALPTVDNIIALSSLLHTSIDEMLCLDEPITIHKENIFDGHSRPFIIEAILRQTIQINLPESFYLFSKKERMVLLKAIKEKRLPVDQEELQYYLTKIEKEYLGIDRSKKG